MADAALLTNNLEKYCSNYYSNQNCSKGDQCPFLHKTRQEVDAIVRPRGEEFFMGRTRTPKVCRYYSRGNCYNKEHCPYVHDVGLFISNNANAENGYSEASEAASASTSSQPLNATLNLNKQLWFGPFTINGAAIGLAAAGHLDSYDDTKSESAPQANHQESPESPAENNNKTDPKTDAEGATSTSRTAASWVNAPEFVPKLYQHLKPKSYAEALIPTEQRANEGGDGGATTAKRLCPFMNKEGVCRNIIDCNYVHGELCDMCERLVLHPFDEELRKKHRQECLEQHEKNMELSFAIARSKEKTCGVCFEVIMEKANGEQRFGILPNCNHCFCLTCIRKWRQARQFDNKIIRACPECRVTSDFVCPSMYWVDTKEDKEKLIDDYKNALATKDCKYFKKGHGKCPFGNKCFYLHAFADGRKCDVGPPPRQRNHRTLEEVLQQVMLWDFLNERDPWNWLSDDFDTESDESDWSDYEMFDD